MGRPDVLVMARGFIDRRMGEAREGVGKNSFVERAEPIKRR
jgi:hypothetical protein